MRPAGESLPVVPFRGVAPLQLVEGVAHQGDNLRDGVALQDAAPDVDGGVVLLAAVEQAHQSNLEQQFVRLHSGEQGVLIQGFRGIAALVMAVRQFFEQLGLGPLSGHHLRQRRDGLVILPQLLELPHRREVLGRQ